MTLGPKKLTDGILSYRYLYCENGVWKHQNEAWFWWFQWKMDLPPRQPTVSSVRDFGLRFIKIRGPKHPITQIYRFWCKFLWSDWKSKKGLSRVLRGRAVLRKAWDVPKTLKSPKVVKSDWFMAMVCRTEFWGLNGFLQPGVNRLLVSYGSWVMCKMCLVLSFQGPGNLPFPIFPYRTRSPYGGFSER